MDDFTFVELVIILTALNSYNESTDMKTETQYRKESVKKLTEKVQHLLKTR